MANFITAYFDDFADSSLALRTDAGNGSFAETTFLRITCPIGVNCEWFTGTNNAPVAYERVHNFAPAKTVYRASMRMFALTTSGNNIFPGLSVWQDRDNTYMLGWDNTSTATSLNRKLAGTGTGLGSSGALAAPSASGHIYRVYWNKSDEPYTCTDEDDFKLLPNRIVWYRSVDNGATFVRHHDRALEFEINNFGVYAYTYGAFPSLDADFDWLRLEYIDPDTVTAEERVGEPIDGVSLNPPVVTGEAMRSGLDLLVGPADHQMGHSGGQLLPGPVDQQPGSIGPFDIGAVDPDVEDLLEIGGSRRHEIPGIGTGHLLGIDRLNKQPGLVGTPEDADDAKLGGIPDFTDNTLDSDFNAHLTEKGVRGIFFYDTTGEDWANPVASSLTGYARDGTRYTAGVQDAGGDTVAGVPFVVGAPWALEAFSVERANRDDFPEQALIVWTDSAITIFDVSNYPTDLGMWMRFLEHASFHMIGNTVQTIRDVKMLNGVMVVATTAAPPGRVHMANFKGDSTATTGQLIGADNHWFWNSDIAGRNTGNFWVAFGALRLNSEDVYSLNIYKDPTQNKVWYAAAGEDDFRIFEFLDDVGQKDYQAARGPTIPANIGDIRNVLFDDSGWLWFSEQQRLHRNAQAWKTGGIIQQRRDDKAQTGVDALHRLATLPEEITGLAAARNYIYCATDVGVYRVHRGSMAVELCYTVAGGGGGGKDSNPPDGELITGDNPKILWLSAFSFFNSSYLNIATSQGVTLVRLFDDYAILTGSITHPALDEPGASSTESSYR